MKRTHTEAFIDEVVECVTITCICKLIVIGRQLLKTLDCNSTEVSRKCCVFRQHCCAPRYEAVDERLSPHVDPASSKLLNHSKLITSRLFSLTLPSPPPHNNQMPQQSYYIQSRMPRISPQELERQPGEQDLQSKQSSRLLADTVSTPSSSKILQIEQFLDPNVCESKGNLMTRQVRRRSGSGGRARSGTLARRRGSKKGKRRTTVLLPRNPALWSLGPQTQ